MLLLTAVMAMAQVKPTDLFDSCVANLKKMKEYSVHIEAVTSKDGKSKRDQFDVTVTSQAAFLRHREPKSGFLDRSDRRYVVRGNSLIGYDSVADERVRRTVKEGATPAAKLANEFGAADLALNLVLLPTSMRDFLGGFRLFRDWRTSHTQESVTFERFPKEGSILLRFSGARHLLSVADLKTNGSMLHWTFDFEPASNIALNIPSDARPVLSFSQREAPPTYKSAQAREVVEQMLKAYGALRYGTIDIKSDDGNSHLVLSGRQLRETRAKFEWAYDGISLSMKNIRKGQFYRGKAKRPILSEYVTKVGGEVDPMLIPILSQRVPYLALFPAAGVVRLIGSVGTKADIIELRTSKLKVSLFVRRDNHLLDSMESETIDRPGRIQTRTQRWFTYSRMGEKIDISDFRLLPGATKVQSLPKLKVLGETE